jgi:thiamine pyrophosphate-dependent acetolactate synthase large subunit-like protein
MHMTKTVADALWEMLVSAGVRRCYGIVGDALNPTIDALRRNGSIEFVHVRNEEYGTFAAVAEASLSGQPVAVCGTAGPGTAHLINGLIDARKERAPVIALAGDVESSLIDSEALEELNPYTFFAAAALYIGRLVNPAQVHSVVGSAITTAIAERGPTVISIPGDVASADAPPGARYVPRPAATVGSASAADLEAIAALVNEATTVAIFGGDGCSDAQAEVRALSQKLAAPVGYSIKGKQWLEHDNPNAVGMNGLLGYGGCVDGQRLAERLRCPAGLSRSPDHRPVRRRGLHHARHGRPSDGGGTKAPVIHIVFNNAMLDFVNIEQQEAGFTPFGTEFVNPDFGRVAEACGAGVFASRSPATSARGCKPPSGTGTDRSWLTCWSIAMPFPCLRMCPRRL